MTERAEELHKEIANIQNSIWRMYKEFLTDHDMGKYNRKKDELAKKYLEKGDRILFEFCKNLLFDWTPVTNTFAKEFGLQ